RQLAARAYELRVLLQPLDDAFERWRQGKMEIRELAAEIELFVNGPRRRRLDQRYHTESIIPMNVAQAIVRGFLTEQEVPAEVYIALENAISFYRQGLAEGTVSFDEED